MYPLIEIKTVPIEIQVKTKNASLEYTRGTAEMEISRSDNGDLDIRSRPIRLQMDTYEARAVSPSVARITSQGAYQATASFAETGQLTVDAKLAQGTAAQAIPGIPTTGQVPSATAEQNESAMQIRYEIDKMNFDWKVEQGKFKFTPGDIEITVEQQPRVTIKYMGGPIYVPRSADPNYEPVDVKA